MPGAAVPGRKRKALWLILLCLVLAFIAAVPRCLDANRSRTLTWDKAQYAGAARDYLQYGEFEERTHSRALFHFLPLGYPALIVGWVKAFGVPVHDAALQVNILAGSLCCVLLLLFTFHVTGSYLAGAFAGFMAAGHRPLVDISGSAMSDASYMFCFILLAWLCWIVFAMRRPRWILGFVLAGLTYAAMYLIRFAAMYLYVGIPGLFAFMALIRRKGGLGRFMLGLTLFLVLGGAVMLLVGLRLERLNGYFTLTPQIAANLATGDFRNQEQLDTFDLDDTGQVVNWSSRNREAPSMAHAWLQDPGGRLLLLGANLRANLNFLWRELARGFGRDFPLALRVLGIAAALALLYALAARRRALGPPAMSSEEWSRAVSAVTVVGLLVAMHVGAYSLINARDRYMLQAMPLLMVPLAILVHFLLRMVLSPARGRSLARETGPAWLRLAALAAVFAVWLGGVVGPQMYLGYLYLHPLPRLDRSAPAMYRPMLDWGRERGRAPVVLYDDSAAPYYAEGYGVIVPYTEANPAKLLHYLDHHGVDFSAAAKGTGFGDVDFDIPAVTLFGIVAERFPDLVRAVNEQVYFVGDLRPSGEAREVRAEAGTCSSLDPGRWLIWLGFAGQPSLHMELRDRGRVLPGAMTWAEARDVRGGVNLYAVFSTLGRGEAELCFSDPEAGDRDAGVDRALLVPLPGP